MKGGENVKRDPVTGFEYPFYSVFTDEWDSAIKEYVRSTIVTVQTYDEAISIIKKIPVSADIMQVGAKEESYDSTEVVAIKVAVNDNPSGYEFYDPRTDKNIEQKGGIN